jgi:hypothetical protein
MAYTPIDKSDDYFDILLWTGDNTSPRSLTGLDFQPDWVWIKRRSSAKDHGLFDSVRGGTKKIESNSTDPEINGDNGQISSFNSDGFSVITGTIDNSGVNGSGSTYVAWNWLAGNGTASNTDGSITSTVSANTTSGFSIVSYTGNLTDGATVGHGLGVTPSCIIFKNRSDVQYWVVYHKDLGGGNNHLRLDGMSGTTTALNMFSSTAPNSSVFELGNKEQVNGNTNNIIAYCFAEKKGFSKFGKYTGNGSTNGAFVYTGFKPAWVVIKRTDSTSNWTILDNKRYGYNQASVSPREMYANASDGESNSGRIDIVSNGFKLRSVGSDANGNGNSYVYMAFAENPFVTSTGIPTCAN